MITQHNVESFWYMLILTVQRQLS